MKQRIQKKANNETLDPAKDTDVENNSESEVKAEAEIPEVKQSRQSFLTEVWWI